MVFGEEREDKLVQFALTPKDYYYELKLAKFLYKIDRLSEPTIEDLAVFCHNFAIGALSRQLGQMYGFIWFIFLFQSYNSSIQTPQTQRIVYEDDAFQSYNSSIQTERLARHVYNDYDLSIL